MKKVYILLVFILLLITFSFKFVEAQDAIINANKTEICLGDSVNFTDGSTGGPTAWDWDFGTDADTVTSTEEDPGWVVWTSAGNKTVTLIVTKAGSSDADAIIITVKDTSEAPTGITGTSTICEGQSTDLTVTGGILGTNAQWVWYDTDPTSGSPSPVGYGSPYSASPTTNTTFYARAEGDCDTTDAVNISITVNSVSTAPTVITATPSKVCLGSSTELKVEDGNLGTGATWEWYTVSCGGTPVPGGTGETITVTPGDDTKY